MTAPKKDKPVTTEDLSTPEILAKPEDVKYVKVTSPLGVETTVPESIVDLLVDSGYTKKK